MPAALTASLKAHRARQIEARLAAGAAWQEGGLVFTSAIGTPLEPRNVVRSFEALLVGAGLPNVRFHDLRHSCATLLVAQGVRPRVVMETLGHSQIGLTMNAYTHVLSDARRAAAATIDALLSPLREAATSFNMG